MMLSQQGGYLIAVKNSGGEIFAEIVANGVGTHGQMFNHFQGENGEALFEANHGTIQQHFYEFQLTGKCLSNPSATIYAWAKALDWRA